MFDLDEITTSDLVFFIILAPFLLVAVCILEIRDRIRGDLWK